MRSRSIRGMPCRRKACLTVFFSVFTYLDLSGLDAGDSALFINGINLDMDSLDMFQLLDLLKQEQRLSTGFHNIGIGVG